nr:MAG TPA: hypothetical protein [Caudoviricetes sp.]
MSSFFLLNIVPISLFLYIILYVNLNVNILVKK